MTSLISPMVIAQEIRRACGVVEELETRLNACFGLAEADNSLRLRSQSPCEKQATGMQSMTMTRSE